jgi:hypothetical protein
MKGLERFGAPKGERERNMQIIRSGCTWLRRIGQDFGPYLVLELVLPGGTLFALLLFLYRRGSLLGQR